VKRIVAQYEDEESARAAEADLREDDLDPERPDVENPFFDPSARPPEARGLLWGGLIGGVIGAAILLAMAMDMIWFPRLSPLISAGRLALVTFGFTVGVAVGGFVGGIWGTLKEIPEPEGPRVAVEVSDAHVDDIKNRLRGHDATSVDDAVTRHGGQ
jgi:hypothetical protein